MIQKQKDTNKNYEGAMTNLGIVSGRQRYAPEINTGNIKKAVQDGQEKVNNIEQQASAAISELKQAFSDRNYKAASDLYDKYNDLLSDKQKAITESAAAASQAIKDAQDLQQKQIENADSLGALVLNNMTGDDAVDGQMIKDLIDAAGLPQSMANYVLSSAAKQQQQLEQKDKASGDVGQYLQALQNGLIPAGTTLQQFKNGTKEDEILSPTEANLLNVPYGTTKSEAASMGIIPKSVSEIVDADGLTPKQTQNFMTITNKFQADALVQSYDKGQGLNAIADQVIANPKTATNQLKSLYILVKNLDPDSAVREGELALANNTTSYLERFKTSLTRLSEGQVISPSAAKDLAIATKELVGAWKIAKDARETRYKSQAKSVGIGDAFNEYLKSSENVENVENVKTLDEFYTSSDENTKSKIEAAMREDPDLTDDEILQIFSPQDFNQVDGDTNKAVVDKVTSMEDGTTGGQCGRFVNKVTNLGLGDTYESKISKMDKTIKNPKPGMVFVMPYKNYGHTGIILGINDGIATVKDSNYSLDGKIKTHKIPVSKMTGFANA